MSSSRIGLDTLAYDGEDYYTVWHRYLSLGTGNEIIE